MDFIDKDAVVELVQTLEQQSDELVQRVDLMFKKHIEERDGDLSELYWFNGRSWAYRDVINIIKTMLL